MRRSTLLLAAVMAGVFWHSVLKAQPDTLSHQERSKFNTLLRDFTLSVYLDTYFTTVFADPAGDTSNLKEFAANCPFTNEFRLNVASLWLEYNASKTRGTFILQFGDIPNLRSSVEEQFIKYMKEAHVGFKLYKSCWIDLGYLPNPIGYESSFPIKNQISTVTVGGFFETGNFLGAKLSAQLTPSFFAGIYVGNPYTLAFGKNKRLYWGLTALYKYRDLLSVRYNNMVGNASIVTSELNHFYIYNNVILTSVPVQNLLLVAQLDVGFMGNSSKPPDTTRMATGYSGFLQATYRAASWFALTMRGEYGDDPDGALSGLYAYDGKLRGLLIYGGTVGLEFNPVPFSYIRAEYSYLSADKGNLVFDSNLTDHRHSLTFTAGVRFGVF